MYKKHSLQSLLTISTLASFLLFTVLLTSCAQLTSSSQNSSQSSAKPIKSHLDSKDYLSFQLENGLEVLAISDPDAEKSAASINVGAGSYQEPDEFPGLAHFLEHLLFLGTEKFPQADAYAKYLSQHGGSHNAFTASLATNYFFDVQPAHLDGALDRLAQFFIAPLLSPAYIEREVKAVNSEWSNTLKDDNRLFYTALRQAFNPKHPAARFSAGNLESLPLDNPELLPALHRFYQDFYVPENLKLVVLAPESTQEIRQLVEKHFQALPARPVKKQALNEKLITTSSLPAQLEFQPLQEKYELLLAFPIPEQRSLYRKKATAYLAHLLGHEGPGSLLAELKQRNLASGLGAGSSFYTGQEQLFMLNIQLTPEGDAKRQEVLDLAFAYIDLIKRDGIEKWRYAEVAQLEKNVFEFGETPSASSLVTHLASNMPYYPMQDLLQASSLYADFDAQYIKNVAQLLTPENLLLVRTSPAVKPQETAKWLPAKYSLQPLETEQLNFNLQNTLTKTAELSLPERNAYIPKNLQLEKTSSDFSPQLIQKSTGLEVWYGLDTSFKRPKAYTYLSLQNPEVAKNLEASLLAKLAANWLEDQLSAQAYAARLAGLNYRIYAHQRGLTFALGGFYEKQPLLAQQILQELQDKKINTRQFARLKQQLSQKLNNQRHQRVVDQLIDYFYRQHSNPKGWSAEQQLAALAPMQKEDLLEFLEEFTQQLYLQVFSWGNLPKKDLLQLAQKSAKALQPQLKAADVKPLPISKLKTGAQQEDISIPHPDNALLLYVQGENSSLQQEALMLLNTQLQKSAFFHEIRTQQQLGYMVFNGNLKLSQLAGSFYYVQSPDHQPSYLRQQVQKFLQEDERRLEQLTATEFSQHQNSLLKQLVEKDKNLSQRAQKYWNQIGSQEYAFTHKQQLAAQVEQLSQQDALEFYRALINKLNTYWLSTSN